MKFFLKPQFSLNMWGDKLAGVKTRRWIMTNFISSTDGNLHDSSRDLSMHRALDPVDLLAALSSSQALFPLVDWIRFSWIQVRKKPATFGIHFILYWDNQHVLSNHQCTTENCPILLFLNPNNCHVLIFEPLRSFPAILPVKTPNTHRIPIYTLYILQLRKRHVTRRAVTCRLWTKSMSCWYNGLDN